MSTQFVREIATEGQVSLTELVQAGLSRHRARHALRSLRAVRLARGLYRIPGVECSDEAIRSAVHRADGVLSHASAAAWWGLDVLVDPNSPQVTVGRHRSRPAPGALRRELADDAVVGHRGLLVTAPIRTVIDCARTLPLVEAVVIADSALRAKAITPDELRAAARRCSRGPGAGRVRAVVDLTDEKCGSVLETLLRVLLVSNGLAPAATQ
ncbi:MAG TPA: hypothetical protein VNA14_13575 [Mycobacteriales bacterium]|nr:hypothetical protein [Mycobacteriales bacterium]